jgi:hypothetical protein
VKIIGIISGLWDGLRGKGEKKNNNLTCRKWVFSDGAA